MKHPGRESERARRRVDQALEVLRGAFGEYLTALPRARPNAFLNFDSQRLLTTFIDRFPELHLERRVRTLAFAAKDARNEVAHYAGALTPDLALHHLSTLRQLLEALGMQAGFDEVDGLYQEQLQALQSREPTQNDRASGGAVESRISPAGRPNHRQSANPRAMDKASPQESPPPQSKYAALYRHLEAISDDAWHTTFSELEAILGFPLPSSARRHQTWWSNTDSHSQAKAWRAAGWTTRDVGLATGRLCFVRSRAIRREPPAAPTSGTITSHTPPSGGRRSRSAFGASQADRIRSFAVEHFVEPAREAGRETVTIRAGDVGRPMGLPRNMPNVCNALGGRRFEALANVTQLDRAGPAVGANTEFTYSINASLPKASGNEALRAQSGPMMMRARPRSSGGPVPDHTTRFAPVVPSRTAVVFPCAAAKARNAGHLRMPDGRRVFFIADPDAAPAAPPLLYRRPDDRAVNGSTFRQVLHDYNLHEEENPWGLLPAWQLYDNGIYRALADRLGIASLFILCAGWGLICADYLTPNYDITFSASAERYKRRTRRDRYEDFQQLSTGDHDRVVFAGGKNYIPMFLSLTDGLDVERIVYYNSASALHARNVRFVPFETNIRTNWHYEWARSLLEGEVRVG